MEQKETKKMSKVKKTLLIVGGTVVVAAAGFLGYKKIPAVKSAVNKLLAKNHSEKVPVAIKHVDGYRHFQNHSGNNNRANR